MLSVALLSNAIGLTHDPLSKARILLGVLGAIVLAVGLLGRRFGRCYTVAVVMIANTLLLLVGLEFGATVVNRLMRTDEMPAYDAVQKEGSLAGVTKAFYVGWRGKPQQGVAVTVDEEGLRVTPPLSSDLADDAIRVFTFGGSTMWGEGATDEETIAAYLQQMLSADTGLTVQVTNYAQRAWVSSQSLIQLTLELQRGHVPDVVVFYDGYNEIFAAYATERTGVPENFAGFSHDSSAESILSRVQTTELGKLLSALRPRVEREIAVDELAVAVTHTYAQVMRLVQALGHEYGFSSRFYWQPQLLGDPKTLTPDELTLLNHPWLPPAVKQLTAAVHARVEELAAEEEVFVDLRDVFEGISAPIYHDPCHIRGAGNKRVAEVMLERGLLGDVRESTAATRPPD